MLHAPGPTHVADTGGGKPVWALASGCASVRGPHAEAEDGFGAWTRRTWLLLFDYLRRRWGRERGVTRTRPLGQGAERPSHGSCRLVSSSNPRDIKTGQSHLQTGPGGPGAPKTCLQGDEKAGVTTPARGPWTEEERLIRVGVPVSRGLRGHHASLWGRPVPSPFSRHPRPLSPHRGPVWVSP